ncbi:hypothetical protein [Celeribacter arenosi]|uniref:Uncharacterized protein n=1 Tax=Celeribacter arenosi TaxID=792649 RepID=A0ABP7JW34_9RHOB
MMLRTALLCLLPSLALASPQDERAALIEQLSDTYALPPTPADANGITAWNPSKILLDDCSMTVVTTSQNRNGGHIIAHTSVNNLSDITFGEPDSDIISRFVKVEGTDGDTYGIVPFHGDAPITVNAHGPLQEFLGPEASAALPIVFQESKDGWRYYNYQTTDTAITNLARTLVEYQRDFCTVAS